MLLPMRGYLRTLIRSSRGGRSKSSAPHTAPFLTASSFALPFCTVALARCLHHYSRARMAARSRGTDAQEDARH